MKRSSGFTLIELMVVIGIMVLISSIVVTGSFGMSRASGYMAAENVVYNTLQAARQKACTDGKRVLVAFIKIETGEKTEVDDYSLVMVEAAGTISEEFDPKNRTMLSDRASSMYQFLNDDGNGPQSDNAIWNLDTGDHMAGPFNTYLKTRGSEGEIPPDGADGKYGYSVTVLKLSSGTFSKDMWKKGHAYGFQIGETQEMPTGFKLGVNSVGGSPEGWLVVFEPDGRSFFSKVKGGGLQGSASGTIFIYEEIAKDNPIKITVANGVIKVDKK